MNKYKIMLVDDEPDILDLLEKALTIEGYCNITKIDNGLSAINTCKEINPDIIVLDVMLPDIDGYEVCKKIREFSHCPILFLSSKNDELDKILGLAVGGDDYVTKPFSPKEIVYRVKAQLRRAEYKHDPKQGFSVKIGELMIDADGCRVMKNNEEIELTASMVGVNSSKSRYFRTLPINLSIFSACSSCFVISSPNSNSVPRSSSCSCS